MISVKMCLQIYQPTTSIIHLETGSVNYEHVTRCGKKREDSGSRIISTYFL